MEDSYVFSTPIKWLIVLLQATPLLVCATLVTRPTTVSVVNGSTAVFECSSNTSELCWHGRNRSSNVLEQIYGRQRLTPRYQGRYNVEISVVAGRDTISRLTINSATDSDHRAFVCEECSVGGEQPEADMIILCHDCYTAHADIVDTAKRRQEIKTTDNQSMPIWYAIIGVFIASMFLLSAITATVWIRRHGSPTVMRNKPDILQSAQTDDPALCPQYAEVADIGEPDVTRIASDAVDLTVLYATVVPPSQRVASQDELTVLPEQTPDLIAANESSTAECYYAELAEASVSTVTNNMPANTVSARCRHRDEPNYVKIDHIQHTPATQTMTTML